MESEWQRIQTKVFIDLWKKHPVLYDVCHPDYNSKLLRNESIRIIMKDLVHYKPNVTLAGVKKKIRTLQSQFCKEKAKIALTNGTYVPTLWCFDDLAFLLNRPMREKGRSDEHLTDEEINDELIEDIKIVHGPSNKKIKKEDCEELESVDVYEEPPFEDRLSPDHSKQGDSFIQDDIDDDVISYIDEINDYDCPGTNLNKQKNYERLQEKKTVAEIHFLQRKTAYFNEILENLKIERRLMNLKAHKLALEIKKMKQTE